MRVIEAVNQNKNILKLNIGVVTDRGLIAISELLQPNDSLEEITITETSDHQKYWSEEGKEKFTEMMKEHTQVRRVKIHFTNKDNPDNKVFEDEVKFYTKMKSKKISKRKDYDKRMKSCDPTHMFENMLSLIEDKKKTEKMPVRMFYKNTFNTLLNQALFKLKKEQERNPDLNEFFTTEGQIKFVAFHLLDNLPDGEIQQDPDMSLGDSEDQ